MQAHISAHQRTPQRTAFLEPQALFKSFTNPVVAAIVAAPHDE